MGDNPGVVKGESNHLVFFSHPLKPSILVLLVAFLEYVILRLLTKIVFQLSIGWEYLTDYSLLFPVPIAFLLLLEFLQRGRPLILSLKRRSLLVHCLFLCLFFGVSAFFQQIETVSSLLSRVLWWSSVGGVLGSVFFVFVSPSFYFKNPNRFVILPCLFIALSIVLYENSGPFLWRFIQIPLIPSVCALLHFVSPTSLSCSSIDFGKYLFISHPALKVLVGQGCGGGDGFFLFLFASMIFFVFYKKNFSSLFWLFFLLVGLNFMFFLNVLRICLLFFVGIWIKQVYPTRLGFILFTKLFHTHIGWLLYLFGMSVYWRIATRFYREGMTIPSPLSSLAFDERGK